MQTIQTTREAGANAILLRRLEQLQEESGKGIVGFKLVFHRLCSWFSIKKEECWELLYYLEHLGRIEIVPYRGIRVSV